MKDYERAALAEILGTLSDMPKGADAIVGRGFQQVSDEIYQLVLSLGTDGRADVEADTRELARARAELSAIGVGWPS